MSYWKNCIKFGLIEHAGRLKYRFHSTNYYEGILVIFQALSILLVRATQELTMKIGFMILGVTVIFLRILQFLKRNVDTSTRLG